MTSRRRPPTFMPCDALVPAGDDLADAEAERRSGSPRLYDASNSSPVEWATPT